jgi:hypothetical protein
MSVTMACRDGDCERCCGWRLPTSTRAARECQCPKGCHEDGRREPERRQELVDYMFKSSSQPRRWSRPNGRGPAFWGPVRS